MTNLLARMRTPIVLAPMGGGPGTPRLAAAVANAGGLGSLAGAYLSPDEITAEIAATRALTAGPINVNLFAGGYHPSTDMDPSPILGVLAPIHEELGIAPPKVATTPPDPFPLQLRAVIAARPEVFSFTFGIPSAGSLREVREAGIAIFGTATTLREAELLADAGVDAIVAQGAEAGAHRGTFAVPFEEAMVPALDLVHEISRAVRKDVIASGGIMNGRDIAAALAAGAVAVQLGTAFLACPEAGTSAPYRRALAASRGADTVITRAYSGRAARGIRNRFIDLVGERKESILPFPIQNNLTRAMRAASARADRDDYLSLWCGTGVRSIRSMPAAELVETLVREMTDA